MSVDFDVSRLKGGERYLHFRNFEVTSEGGFENEESTSNNIGMRHTLTKNHHLMFVRSLLDVCLIFARCSFMVLSFYR
jgi:hypothetical protein